MKYSGFSLIEISISLLLGSIMMLIILHQYSIFKRSYYQSKIKLENSYERQFLTDFMRDSIRSAGFTPCRNLDRLKTVDTRNKITLIKSLQVHPEQAVTIYRMSENFNVVKQILSITELITTAYPSNLNNSIIIADCEHAEVHDILETHKVGAQQSIRLKTPLVFEYHENTYLGEWVEEKFFIKSQAMGNSLWYQKQRAEQLTTLVQGMQVSQAKNLVTILLDMQNAKPWEFTTKIRA